MLYTVNFVKRSNVTKINKTRRMAITNGTCVSFCYQPKAHYLATSRVTPVCRCLQPICECSLQAFGLRQESLRNILASPEYAPGTIVVNVTWMERGFNACQTHGSMYPSIVNRFPVIQPVNLKNSPFQHIFAHFGLPWVRPWDNRGKCHTVRKRIQCL